MVSFRVTVPEACRTARVLLLGVAFAGAAGVAHAATIYSCIDASGRRLTADRPIPECATREQRILNGDGSVQRILPPSMTPEEQAAADARARQAAAERAALQDAIRRDRNLLNRFPDEAAHNRARQAALDDVDKGVRFSESRLKELERERKPLIDEGEFYVGKTPPLKLRQQLDANDAATEAQRSLVQNQKQEILRIDRLYDAELQRLRRLWAGSAPGSLGAITSASQPAAKPATAPRNARP